MLARARGAVELAVAKHQVEQHVSPEITKDRDAALRAMKGLERDWHKAINKIAERAGLTKGSDGWRNRSAHSRLS